MDEQIKPVITLYETDHKRLIKKLNTDKKETQKFWNHIALNGIEEKKFNQIVETITRHTDCNACANCCIAILPILSTKDVNRMAKHMGLKKGEYIEKYLKPNGKENYEFRFKPCPMLKNNHCEAYESRPEACRGFPFLDHEIKDHPSRLIHNAQVCPIAYNVLENSKREFMKQK